MEKINTKKKKQKTKNKKQTKKKNQEKILSFHLEHTLRFSAGLAKR